MKLLQWLLLASSFALVETPTRARVQDDGLEVFDRTYLTRLKCIELLKITDDAVSSSNYIATISLNDTGFFLDIINGRLSELETIKSLTNRIGQDCKWLYPQIDSINEQVDAVLALLDAGYESRDAVLLLVAELEYINSKVKDLVLFVLLER